MVSNKKLLEIYNDIMRELYTEAEPSLDWDALIASSEEVRKEFDFNNHYLDQEMFDEIVKRELSKYPRLTKREISTIRGAVYLGASPRSNKNK